MDNIAVKIFLIFFGICAITNQARAQCFPTEAAFEGRCFYTKDVARNLQMAWRWNHPLAVEWTPTLQSATHELLRLRFLLFSEAQRTRNLNRAFCVDSGCPTLNITLTRYLAGDKVKAEFHVLNVNNLLQENPSVRAQDALQRAVSQGSFNITDGSLGTSGTAESFTITLQTPYCPPGTEMLGSGALLSCGECTMGYFYNSTQRCSPCPVGTYQDGHGQSGCDACPGEYSTNGVGKRSAGDCYRVCESGNYLDRARDVCVACPLGTYQLSTGQDFCSNCTEGKITYGPGSTLPSQCVDPCVAGQALLSNGTCVLCPLGTYLSQPLTQILCTACPEGFTTTQTGAASADQCNLVVCPAGQYREGINPGRCVPCPVNTYRSAEMTVCVSCGAAESWRTDAPGATSFDQCRFYCPAGSFITQGGFSCQICPHDTYKPANNYYNTSCSLCPPDRPKTASDRSTSLADCAYARCDRGYEINHSSPLTCRLCDYGFYQPVPEPIFQTCQPCPQGTSTRALGADSSADCETYCESGYEKVPLTGSCRPCRRGYYKNNALGVTALFGACVMCDVSYVTPGVASTSAADCTVRNCTLGHYLDTEVNECVECGRGTYQDELYRTGSCKACPSETTTVGTGATSINQCSVTTDRMRLAFRLKLDEEWRVEYLQPNSSQYVTLRGRILAHFDHALTEGVPGYRRGLILRSLSPGSVVAHAVAMFYSGDSTVEADLSTALANALNNEQISGAPVQGFEPLALDRMATDAYAVTRTLRDYCGRGEQLNYATGACEPCPVGRYQEPQIADVCLACATGYSTLGTGTVGAQQHSCHLVCGPGWQADSGECVVCPRHSYKPERGVQNCTACGGQLITTETGATSYDSCMAACGSGLFSNSARVCEVCPLNTYNPSANRQSCTNCPNNERTISTGSTLDTQCLVHPPPTSTSTTTASTTTASSAPTTSTLAPSISSPAPTNTSTPEAEKLTDDGWDSTVVIYAAAGGGGGFVLLVVIIVAAVCISRRRAHAAPNVPRKSAELQDSLERARRRKQHSASGYTDSGGYTEVTFDSPTYQQQGPTPGVPNPATPTAPGVTQASHPGSGFEPEQPQSGGERYSPGPERRTAPDTLSSIPDILAPTPPRSSVVTSQNGAPPPRYVNTAPSPSSHSVTITSHNGATTSSSVTMTSPSYTPRSVTTVSLGEDERPQIRHSAPSGGFPNRKGSKGSKKRIDSERSTGFDPVPDSLSSMPPMLNPLLDNNNIGDVVYINGVATIPAQGYPQSYPPDYPQGYPHDYPPGYPTHFADTDPSGAGKKGKKKKGKKKKSSKHVLIDTQRNMVHTFKSTGSDVSSLYSNHKGMLPPATQGQGSNGVGVGSRLRRTDVDALKNEGIYETIPAEDGLI